MAPNAGRPVKLFAAPPLKSPNWIILLPVGASACGSQHLCGSRLALAARQSRRRFIDEKLDNFRAKRADEAETFCEPNRTSCKTNNSSAQQIKRPSRRLLIPLCGCRQLGLRENTFSCKGRDETTIGCSFGATCCWRRRCQLGGRVKLDTTNRGAIEFGVRFGFQNGHLRGCPYLLKCAQFAGPSCGENSSQL